MDKISTLDAGYTTGDLSIYPDAIDSTDTLYEVSNNAETTLLQTLTFNGKFILVDDISKFPDKGLIRIGTELIYYSEKDVGIFKSLKRGFAGSLQNQWLKGTKVAMTVDAEPHNATKDAIINIENYLGLKDNPTSDTLNGALRAQEKKLLTPRPLFRASPLKGSPPFKVRFKNFSTDEGVKFLWDFGDGGVSTEKNPMHTYLSEGIYTVTLKMITSLGGQGSVTKSNYISVDYNYQLPLMYVHPLMGTESTTFTFVDQTHGDIVSRYWIFGDNTQHPGIEEVSDPDEHVVTHSYSLPFGETSYTYYPSLIILFKDQSIVKLEIKEGIEIHA